MVRIICFLSRLICCRVFLLWIVLQICLYYLVKLVLMCIRNIVMLGMIDRQVRKIGRLQRIEVCSGLIIRFEVEGLNQKMNLLIQIFRLQQRLVSSRLMKICWWLRKLKVIMCLVGYLWRMLQRKMNSRLVWLISNVSSRLFICMKCSRQVQVIISVQLMNIISRMCLQVFIFDRKMIISYRLQSIMKLVIISRWQVNGLLNRVVSNIVESRFVVNVISNSMFIRLGRIVLCLCLNR